MALRTHVIPAKAGTQGDCDVVRPLGPRFRGDDVVALIVQ